MWWICKLIKPFYKNSMKIPICCVGCKYGKNMKCYKTKYKRKPCPNCGCEINRRAHILSNMLPFWWYIECDNCHWCGKTKLFLWRAVRAWNKQRRVSENEIHI